MQLSTTSKNWFALLCSLAALAVVWLALLPWLASQPAVSSHLKALDNKKIDGGAMFYTELEAMEPILRESERHPRLISPNADLTKGRITR